MRTANLWEKIHGASRRRKDRALLAALERDIADGERIAAANEKAERERIAKAFGRPIFTRTV